MVGLPVSLCLLGPNLLANIIFNVETSQPLNSYLMKLTLSPAQYFEI